MSHIVKATEC